MIMRKIVIYIIYTILIACIACACSSDIDIRQNYEFKVTHLPVPKKLKVNETAEIRCQLQRSGEYQNTKYYLRYFQPDGKGELKMDDGTVFLPNDTYELSKETFRLYYTSLSDDQEVINIYFSDSFGNEFQLSFSFNNDNDKEEEDA